LVKYNIAWTSEASHEATFRLAEHVEVTVLTTLPWIYQSGTFTTTTAEQDGKVSLLIRSLPQPTGIRDIAIVCSIGLERQAAIARAACGWGFVPCFVIDPRDATALERMTASLDAFGRGIRGHPWRHSRVDRESASCGAFVG